MFILIRAKAKVFMIGSVSLVLVCFCCCDKTWTTSNLGRKRFISSSGMSRVGTQGRNLEAETEAKTMLLTGFLSMPCSAHFLVHPRTSCLGWLGPPTSVDNQENAHIHAHKPVWWRQILSWSSLFLGDAILCQVDKNELVQLSLHV